MLEINQIYCGNNLDLIKQLDNNCIDLTVTSPPYDNLRTYNGFEWDFEGLAKECARVLKQDGVLVFLDTRIPMWAKADGWKLKGTIGFNQSTQHRTRTITILEKSR